MIIQPYYLNLAVNTAPAECRSFYYIAQAKKALATVLTYFHHILLVIGLSRKVKYTCIGFTYRLANALFMQIK